MNHIKISVLSLVVLSGLLSTAVAVAQDTDPVPEAASVPPESEDITALDARTEDATMPPATAGAGDSLTQTPATSPASETSDGKTDSQKSPPSKTLTVELAGPDARHATDAPPPAQTGLTPKLNAPKTLNPFLAVGDEMFLGMALITAWGVHFWDWFEGPFHFEREHGFTQESSTGGADKTGHFFTSYVIADFLNWRLRKQGWTPLRSSLVSASVAMGLMTWIEIGDATSAYGFSWEDMLADFIGVAISAGLGVSPIADELLDFRIEYWPTASYMDGGVMAADYSGMKYLMALRMTGIKPLKKTPLRFVEWHVGYYSRGFRSFDKTTSTNRVTYFGMGIDLKEIFDKFIPKKYKRPFDVVFTYYQVPYTSWTIHKWEHPWSKPTERITTPLTPQTQP